MNKTNSWTKRLLSLILVVAMVVAFALPAGAITYVGVVSAVAGTYENGESEARTDKITVTFAEEVVFNDSNWTTDLIADNAGNPADFGLGATAALDATDATKLVITLGEGADVEPGCVLEFTNGCVVSAADPATEADSAVITGSLTPASVDYLLDPIDAELTMEGYTTLPTELGIGTYHYSARKDGYAEASGSIAVTAADLGNTVTIDLTLAALADYSQLNAAILAASVFGAADYTPDSYQALQNAVAAGQGVATGLLVDQQGTIDALKADINDAINALVALEDVSFAAVAVASDVTANYAKADKVVLVFNQPLATGADILGKLTEKDQFTSAQWLSSTICELTLAANHTLTNGAELHFVTDYTVMTESGKAMTSAETVVSGNLEEAYELVTATAATATIVKGTEIPGVQTGDTIVLVFNAPVKDAPNPLEVTVDGSAVKNAVPVNGSDNTVYTVALQTGDAVTDNTVLSCGDISNISLQGSFGTAVAPVIQSVVAVETTGDALTKDDMIVITFDRPTNGVAIDATTLMGGIFKNDAVAQWNASNTELTITLGTAAEISNGMTINLSGLGITDAYGTAAYVAADVAVDGTFVLPVAPVVTGALIVDNDGTAKTKGDVIIITFDRPTNGVTITPAMLAQAGIVLNANQSFGGDASAAWNSEKTELTITIGQYAALEDSVALDLDSLGIMDTDNLVAFAGGAIDPVGSFGTSIAPKITRAIAFTQGTRHIVRLFFNTEVTVKSTLDVSMGSNFDMGDYDTAWVHNGISYFDIILGEDHSEFATNTVTVTLEGVLEDVRSGKTAENVSAVIGGGFEQDIEPEILSANIYSQDGSGVAKVGDKIVLVLNSAVTDLDCAAYDFVSTDKVVWTYTLVDSDLRATPVPAFIGDSLAVTIKALGKTFDRNATIGGSLGLLVAPELLSATYYSKTGTGVAKVGDEIVLVFNTPVDFTAQPAYGTAATTDGIVWTVTVSNPAAITLDTEVSYNVTSRVNGTANNNCKATLTGSFGNLVLPKLLSATYYSQDGSGVAKVGDKIVLVFNTPVDFVAPDYATAESSDGIVWILTTTKTTIVLGQSVSVAATSRENGKTESCSITLGGSFGLLVTPELLSATYYSKAGTGIAKVGDEIVLVFNTPVDFVAQPTYGTAATTDGIIWTVTVSTPAAITLGTEVSYNVTSRVNGTANNNCKTTLTGSFGKEVTPEIFSATAVSRDHSGVAKKGDEIVLVFNTKVTVTQVNSIDVQHATGEVYSYTLTRDREVAIGETLNITVLDVNGKEHVLSVTVGGSFGHSMAPVIKSVILSEGDNAEVITVRFDSATNRATVNADDLETINTAFGNVVSSAWIDEYTLKITLGTDAMVSSLNSLDLSGFGIKDKNNVHEVTVNDAGNPINALPITGNLVPVVKSVEAGGKTITITFSTRTNGVADLSSLTALLGVGATAAWTENNKVLTITLGTNYTITGDSYIVLNGMGIRDGFAGNNLVIGQYKIDSGAIDADKLVVDRIYASSTDKTTSAAQKGDSIYIKFNAPTNMNGKTVSASLTSEDVAALVQAAGGNDAMFGAGYTGVWSNFDTLLITLGEAPAITLGTKITVSGLAFANNTGTMDITKLELTGSFNGREYVVTEGAMAKNGDYIVSAKVEMIKDTVAPTVVCVAYSGTAPISVMRMRSEIDNSATVVFEFSGSLMITGAKIYVFDQLFDTIGENPAVLAEVCEIGSNS